MSEGTSSGLAKEPFGDTARPLPVLFGPRKAPPGGPERGERRVARFLPKEGTFRCPVPGCPQGQEGAGCKTSFNLRYHFAYRHPADTVVVRGEAPPQVQELRAAGVDGGHTQPPLQQNLQGADRAEAATWRGSGERRRHPTQVYGL